MYSEHMTEHQIRRKQLLHQSHQTRQKMLLHGDLTSREMYFHNVISSSFQVLSGDGGK